MSRSFDPNDYYDDDFNIEDYTSQVDFGHGMSSPPEQGHVGDTGEYTPVGRETPMPAKRPRKHTRKKSPRSVRFMKGLLKFLVYLLVMVLAAYFLAGAGWKWANDLLALNKDELDCTVTLSEEMFTEKASPPRRHSPSRTSRPFWHSRR